MALQNIGAGNKNDAFYRYKMPKLLTKIEGRGNGIKTNLVNMVDVAKALGRPPSYTTKFFGCELGAQSKFDEKSATAIVNGAHDNAKMVALLEIFIKKYVQCYGCGNPETAVTVTKGQTIVLKCAACGFVSDVDMRDKLTTFILKNPPEQEKGGKDKKGIRKADKERLNEGESLDEEAKKLRKEARKKKGHDETSKVSKKKASGSDGEEHSPSPSPPDEDENVTDAEDGVQWQTDTSAEAAQQRIKEQLTSVTSEMVMLENRKPDLESKDNSSKKSGKKVAGQKTSAKKLEASENENVDATLEKVKDLSLKDMMVEEFKECLKNGMTAAELVSRMSRKTVPQQDAMVAYFEALFGGIHKGLAKVIAKKKIYLAKAVQDETSQGDLLKAIESHYLNGPPEARKEIALVLKLLYDEDILEEAPVFEWYDNRAKNGVGSKPVQQVLKNAEPFVEWLHNAEAESDEE